MGRRSALAKDPGLKEEIIILYDKYQRAGKVGEKVGLSGRTVRKYLKSWGYKIPIGGRKWNIYGGKPHYGALITWVREHPEIKLPRSVSKICKLTEIGKDAVKTYLYRRRIEARNFITSNEDKLRDLSVSFTTTEGQKIPAKILKSYKVYWNTWNFNVKIKAFVKGARKPKIFRFSFEEFKRLFSLDEEK